MEKEAGEEEEEEGGHVQFDVADVCFFAQLLSVVLPHCKLSALSSSSSPTFHAKRANDLLRRLPHLTVQSAPVAAVFLCTDTPHAVLSSLSLSLQACTFVWTSVCLSVYSELPSYLSTSLYLSI